MIELRPAEAKMTAKEREEMESGIAEREADMRARGIPAASIHAMKPHVRYINWDAAIRRQIRQKKDWIKMRFFSVSPTAFVVGLSYHAGRHLDIVFHRPFKASQS